MGMQDHSTSFETLVFKYIKNKEERGIKTNIDLWLNYRTNHLSLKCIFLI